MISQSSFHNISLADDIAKGIYPETSYNFYCEVPERGVITLFIYPSNVKKVSRIETGDLQSYSYMKRQEVIQDLENWAVLNMVSLKAIVSEKAQADSPQLKTTFETGREMPTELAEIINCLAFWNREGLSIYVNNIFGKLGSRQTQEQARKIGFDDWLLNSILIDCQVFIKPYGDKYKTGRGGHHVWLCEGNERFAMIHL